MDTTQVEVYLETGTYECSGVVKNDDGSYARGYKLATLRTLLDQADLITQVGLCPIQVHDLPLCRLFLETAMLSYQEAVQLAALQGQWQPHPSRDDQHIAIVKGVDLKWDGYDVALNACVIRYWSRKKQALDHIVLVTTDQRLIGSWIVRHYEERSEIEQDYQQMQSGGWQLKKLSSTRYSEIVFYILTVVLSYSLYHLFCNTRAGARFADKTRQALAFEQLRSRRTHIIAYARGYFEIFETLSWDRFVLQLPAAVQERLLHWLDEHLRTITQRE